jgi:tetratricopeptide (TPR) repeat protein
MRKIFLAMAGGACALWLAGCGGAPGERDFKAGVREYEQGNFARAMTHFEKVVRQPGGEAHAAAWNYLGCAAWQLHQLPAAREAFEASLRAEPNYAAAQFNLAALQAAGGNASAAVGLLLPIATREAVRTEPLELLGQIYLDRQMWPEARNKLIEAAQRAPDTPRILTRLALAELGAGDERTAIGLLNRALDRDGRYAPALFNLSLIYHQRLGDRVQAAVLLRRFLEVAPKGEQAEYARQLLADLGSAAPPPAPVAPTSGVRSVVRPAPTSTPARIEAAPARTVDVIVREAVAEAERGHAPRAVILFLEAASRAEREQNPAAQEKALTQAAKYCFDQARIHAALGRFQLDRGRTDAAVKSFKQAIVLDGKFVPAHLGLAEAAGRTGEYDVALVALKNAVQVDPLHADAQWQLAQLYDLGLKSAERAAASYRQFIKQFPGDARVVKAQERLGTLGTSGVRGGATTSVTPALKEAARPKKAAQATPVVEAPPVPVAANPQAAVQAYNRARQYQAQQDWESAITYYKRALENNAGMANAWFNLGLVHAAKGDNTSARDAYEHAIKVQPDMTAARYNLALLLLGARKRDEALVHLREMVKLQSDNAAAYYVLGYVLADDPLATQQAKQAYRKFIELAPNDPNAANVRDWLARH